MLNKPQKESKMNKRTFVKLELLLDVTYEGETAEDNAVWVQNVTYSGVADGYTFECGDAYTTADFACSEMEFADDSVKVYDYMGGAQEQESFYLRDIVVFKHIATGDFYVIEVEDLGEF